MITGFISDLPTPFAKDGTLDLPAFRDLVRYQLDAGIEAMVITETTGEASTLRFEERRVLITEATGMAKGNAAILAGSGSNSTAQAIALAQMAANAGADAIISVVPYYNRPTQEGLCEHFRAIAAATSLPIIVNDQPGRCARELSDETIRKLFACKAIAGIYDGTSRIERLLRLAPLRKAGLRMWAADPGIATTHITLGGNGCIAGSVAVFPQLHQYLLKRQWQDAAFALPDASQSAATVCELIAQDHTPATIKYALSLLAIGRPLLRPPLAELNTQCRQAVAEAMAPLCA